MTNKHIGELFWEEGVNPAVKGQEILLFPGVPLHGKAPENSALIGIIDSGMAMTHPQLAGYVRTCVDFVGEEPEDTLGHGTAVALQLLYGNGDINPSIAILSAKVTDTEGDVLQQAVVDAIDWMAQQGAKIVNLSLGFLGSNEDNEALCTAIGRHPELHFVAAVGNYGPEVDVFPAACGRENVITVGATDDNGKIAKYSGTGDIYLPGKARFQKEWAYHYERAQALASSGHLHEARREYERSLQAQTNPDSEFQIGLLELNGGNLTEAIIRFNEAIKLYPSFPEAYDMLGAARMLLGQYQEAEKALRTSIELYPQNDAKFVPGRAQAHFNLGQVLVNLGQPKEARAQFEIVKSLMPDYPRIDDALASLET